MALWATVEVNLAVIAGMWTPLSLLISAKSYCYSLPAITSPYISLGGQWFSEKHSTKRKSFCIKERQIEPSDTEHAQKGLFRLYKTTCGHGYRRQWELQWST